MFYNYYCYVSQVLALDATQLLDGEMQDVQKKISVFQKYMDTLPEKAFSLGIRIVLTIIVFFIGMQAIKIVRKLMKAWLTRINAETGVIQFLDSFVKAILYIILILCIASSFGLDAATIVTVLGSCGVALGLALQGSLSNLAGGVLILILKPFKVGDYIKEDNKGNEGTVSEIQIFYTKLVTPDDKIIILPNGPLANSSLTNVTHSPTRRLTVKVGIAYSADLIKAKNILQDITNQLDGIRRDADITIFVDDLADSSVVLGIHCFVNNEDYWAVRSTLLEKIKLTFDKEEIAIPFPQLDVHMQS